MVAKYKVRTITCQGCGQVVTKRMRANTQFCSHQCFAKSPKPDRKTGQDRKCNRCGEKFYVPRSRLDLGQGLFCSVDCWNKEQGKNKTQHQCKVCGKDFFWSPSRSASGNYKITYCSLKCRDNDPERLSMLLQMNKEQQSGKTTKAERAGYDLLDQLGVEYVRQANFAGKFTPDAVVPNSRLVIQFDGDYWHDRTGINTEPRIEKRRRLDASQDKYIRTCGWEVLRLWESDLLNEPDICAQKIVKAINRKLGKEPKQNPLVTS